MAPRALSDWMVVHRFQEFTEAFVDKLGVETLSDLVYVTEGDLEAVGLRPVQRRRFLKELEMEAAAVARPSSPDAGVSLPSPRVCLQDEHDPSHRGLEWVFSPATGSSMSDPGAVATAKSQVCPSTPIVLDKGGSGSNDAVEGDTEEEPEDDERLEMYDVLADEGSDDEASLASPRALKRRRLPRATLRGAQDSASRAAGTGHLRLSERRVNGTARRPSPSSTSAGTRRVTQIAGVSCDCKRFLQALEPQLVAARRVGRERDHRATAGSSAGGQTAFNYARLGPLVLNLIFDAAGNWMVHEVCARVRFGVSNSWLSSKHKQAIRAAKIPTVFVTKSEIAASPHADSLVQRILRLNSCMMSVTQYYKSCDMNSRLELVAKAGQHGLTNRISNRCKVAERALFQKFVMKHRSPTGRTPDTTRRYHGAVYYLDSMWSSLRLSSGREGTDSERFCFSASFNAALAAPNLKPVHSDVPPRWLGQLFGSTTIVSGVRCPSAEHTVLHPHKTDACPTCETLRADIRQAAQVLKRHRQQSDQSSLLRRNAVEEVERTLVDLRSALAEHTLEAAVATEHHRRCLVGAAEHYEKQAAAFHQYMDNGATEQRSEELDVTAQEEFVRTASSGWFDLSSDYQQDKTLPSWRRTPQPGPTYFMSGETHYVLIFCVESCGLPAAPSRISRNVVYSRSECVGGAKSSDDTLSTLCDLLLGGARIGGVDPPVFREGYSAEDVGEAVSLDHQ